MTVLKIYSLIVITALNACSLEKKFSNKEIDEAILNIQASKNLIIYKDKHALMAWDTIKGSHTDTAIYQYDFDSNDKSLAIVNFKHSSDQRIISFYFLKDRLIAAKIVSDKNFPSWSNTLIYFNEPYRYNKNEIVLMDVGSEKEKDVRQSLLLEAYSTLDIFIQIKKTSNAPSNVIVYF